MYSRFVIKSPSDGTCPQWSLLSLFVTVHVLKGHYKVSLSWYIYSVVPIKPPSEGICAQEPL